MRNKKLVNTVQNLLLAVLSLSAVFLFSRLPLFQNGLAQRFQTLLYAQTEASGQSRTSRLDELFPAVHLVITDASEYGRCVRMYAGAKDGLLRQFVPLFREALGSAAASAGAAAERTLRSALASPSLYMDLTEELPLNVVAAWLGESIDLERDVCAMALSAGEGDKAVLYLRTGSGDVYRCYTALPASAVLTLCQAYPPNGGRFAFDGGYGALAPYTVLPAEDRALTDVQAALPAGATTYNILTALDFNAHTLSRYTESSGTEVVEESSQTLRISPSGTVSFSGRSQDPLPLYQVTAAGETPTAVEVVETAWGIAQALTAGTGASPLYLRAVERTGENWVICFRYQAEGVPVRFSDEEDALRVIVSGTAVTAFTYRCRSYTAMGDPSLLLPVSMAAAIAGQGEGNGLSLAYVDAGAGVLSAQWIPQ